MSPRSALGSVVVATNLEAGSDAVVHAGARLARRTGAGLHLLHALDLQDGGIGLGSYELVRMQVEFRRRRKKLQDQLERVAPEAVGESVTAVSYQDAPGAILRRAGSIGAGLIVLGPPRERFPGSHLFGTTVQRVVQEATVPCLVTAGPLGHPLRRILVAVDHSDLEHDMPGVAADWLTPLLEPEGGTAHLPYPGELNVRHFVRDPDSIQAAGEAMPNSGLVSAGDVPLPSGWTLRTRVARAESPAEGILQASERERFDLIVMSPRERGAFRRAILGSVSSDVLRRSSTPILFLPPNFAPRSQAGAPAGASVSVAVSDSDVADQPARIA